jgi:hypothetical protein
VEPAKAVAAPGALPGSLSHFFAGYADGSDFAFMRSDCTPKMARFVSLVNVGIDDVIRNAKTFFRTKRELEYRPDVGRMRVEAGAEGKVVRLPVTMSWTYPVPKDWGPDWPSWVRNEPVVVRRVTANVEIQLDAEGRLSRYIETSVERPLLRVTGEENCDPTVVVDRPRPEPWLTIKTGDLVRDLGETVVISINAKGADTARKIRLKDEDGWTLDSVSFAVDSPLGGTSAGGSDCLAPVRAGKS